MKKIIRLNESDLFNIVRRVLREQTEGGSEFKFQLNFSKPTLTGANIVAENVNFLKVKIDYDSDGRYVKTYENAKFNVVMDTKAARYTGPSKTMEVKYTPPQKDPDRPVPKLIMPQLVGDNFKPNFITPKPKTIKALNPLIKNVLGITKFILDSRDGDAKAAGPLISDYFKGGFTIIGHADGSVPSATNVNQTDHGNLGLYGGVKGAYNRNSWLATQRAKNVYAIFYRKLINAAKRMFDDSIVSRLENEFNLLPYKLKVENHLNKDGTTNESEIGLEYRKMELIANFNPLKGTIPGKTIPGKTENYLKINPGTKVGVVTLPIEDGGEGGGIEGIQIQDEGIAGSLWYGIPEESVDQLVKVGYTSFNGKSTAEGKIIKEGGVFMLYVDGVNTGQLISTANAKGITMGNMFWTTPGMLCVHTDKQSQKAKINDKVYVPVFYINFSFNK